MSLGEGLQENPSARGGLSSTLGRPGAGRAEDDNITKHRSEKETWLSLCSVTWDIHSVTSSPRRLNHRCCLDPSASPL